ncbi:MAG TPA: hypothetical protein PKC49_04895 [Phycisphaerae bacterium]|nr:hypothetical protein [Phycisphaerae bacterium]
MSMRIQPDRLELLLRQVAELDDLIAKARPAGSLTFRSPGGPMPRATRLIRVRPWVAVLATAAAIVLSLMPNWTVPTREPSRAGPGVLRVADEHANGRGEYETCALLLFQAWSNDCVCTQWHAREFSPDALAAHVFPGGGTPSTFDVADSLRAARLSPLLNEPILVALIRRPIGAPHDDAARETLLNCLNETAPCEDAGASSHVYAAVVRQCLPAAVSVVPDPLMGE